MDACRGRQVHGSGSRVRIGFLSAYFRDHTIGRLNLGRIQHLPRDRFEVIVLSVGKHNDEMAQAFAKAADKYVVVPREVSVARQLIAEQQLDILFFTDVGMDALTYTLAFSRMAPVQCTTWGHPVTTGSPMMDYFVSSELLEVPDAGNHYTEQLVRLKSMGTYYYRPQLTQPAKKRADLGLPTDRHLYVCPQTLFKFHPDFDAILAEILRRDRQGELILIEGRTANWTRLLKERFSRVMPDVVDRIRWLPALANQDFLQLLALADIVLDPIHFGGGNTSYEALAIGTPVLTLPGDYLRSRISRALYAKMGFVDCQGNELQEVSPVADSIESYIETAVRLTSDLTLAAKARRLIAATSNRLFENGNDIEDLAEWFASAADRRPD